MKSEEKNGLVDRTPWDDENGRFPLLLSSLLPLSFLLSLGLSRHVLLPRRSSFASMASSCVYSA